MKLRKLDMTGITVTEDHVMLRLDWYKNEKGHATPGIQKNYSIQKYGSDRLAIMAAAAERDHYRKTHPAKSLDKRRSRYKRKLRPGQLISGIAYVERKPNSNSASLRRYFSIQYRTKRNGTRTASISIPRILIGPNLPSEPFTGTHEEIREYELKAFKKACQKLAEAEKEHYPRDWHQWIPENNRTWLEKAFDQIMGYWIEKHGEPNRTD